MDVIYSLIPGMMIFGLLFVVVLIWAVRKGQYEDMEGNASRILLDGDEDLLPHPNAGRDGQPGENKNTSRPDAGKTQ